MKNAFAMSFVWAATAVALCGLLSVTKGPTVLFAISAVCACWSIWSHIAEHQRDAELRKLERLSQRHAQNQITLPEKGLHVVHPAQYLAALEAENIHHGQWRVAQPTTSHFNHVQLVHAQPGHFQPSHLYPNHSQTSHSQTNRFSMKKLAR